MKKKGKVDIIIQARLGSTRLKGKVLKMHRKINILKILVERMKNCKNADEIIICTTKKTQDNKIVKFCNYEKIKVFRGSNNNVLSRYHLTAKKFKTDVVIRITSDCPFVDFRIVDNMIYEFRNKKLDYYANTYPLPTNYPDGMDIEIFTSKALKKANKDAILPSEREHVTPYFYNSGKFKIGKKRLRENLSKYRFCIDYQSDFILLKKIINHFNNKIFTISMKQLVNFVKIRANLISYQKKIIRNEGWKSSLLKDEKFK